MVSLSFTFHLGSCQVTGHKTHKTCITNNQEGFKQLSENNQIDNQNWIEIWVLATDTKLFLKIGELKEFSLLHLICKSEAFSIKSGFSH